MGKLDFNIFFVLIFYLGLCIALFTASEIFGLTRFLKNRKLSLTGALIMSNALILCGVYYVIEDEFSNWLTVPIFLTSFIMLMAGSKIERK